MRDLIRKHPDLKDVSAIQLLDALQGAGVERVKIEFAVKKLADQTKRNKRVGKSIETVLKF
jgi:hypothetical protein